METLFDRTKAEFRERGYNLITVLDGYHIYFVNHGDWYVVTWPHSKADFFHNCVNFQDFENWKEVVKFLSKKR